MPAHPRSRGENSNRGEKVAGAFGSSPLTRGKHLQLPELRRRARLIPAHAGKTIERRARSPPRAAHPRSRGENVSGAHVGPVLHGSSPLTRGKLHGLIRVRLCSRLIPAHAGKTRSSRARIWSAAAHPRSRGENIATEVFGGIVSGSSPLTRGKPVERLRDRRPRRLIPAHAGKTPLRPPTSGERSAHPRSRGENETCAPERCPPYGSSPLTRGKRDLEVLGSPFTGLIPAHAGKTDVR